MAYEMERGWLRMCVLFSFLRSRVLGRLSVTWRLEYEVEFEVEVEVKVEVECSYPYVFFSLNRKFC